MTASLLLSLILPLVWQPIELPSNASFRAVAVSRDGAICLSGNGPEVWVSTDGGKKWLDRKPEYEGVTDYRCVAIPANNVIFLASAGSPSVILRSDDLGSTWNTVHEDKRPAAFIDGLRFWDGQRGFSFGDPIGGRFLLLRTRDGGRSWGEVSSDVISLEGEAGFAASNGSMELFGRSSLLIGLGGRADHGASRVMRSDDDGETWEAVEVKQIPAGPSQGIFALSLRASGFGVAVGGDYKRPDESSGNVAVTDDGGRSWRLPNGRRPGGFRSSVIFVLSEQEKRSGAVGGGFWLATGPTGTDISDDGEDWRKLSDTGFHALNLLPSGSPIAVGKDGRIALLVSE